MPFAEEHPGMAATSGNRKLPFDFGREEAGLMATLLAIAVIMACGLLLLWLFAHMTSGHATTPARTEKRSPQ
jgi:hypothetical protein